MKAKLSLILTLGMLAVLTLPVQAAVFPTISILSVVKDESITIQTRYFPADETFYVRMGYNGTQGVNGLLVTKIITGAGGTFKAKFYIPEELKGEGIIAIRMESTTSLYYSYNWFYNKTAVSSSSSSSSSSSGSTLPNDFPTFHITAVSKGSSVSIETLYFPAGETFAVYMKDAPSAVKTWYWVAGMHSGEGGSFTATWAIPTELQWKSQIAIKFYNMNDGWITYNLFMNKDYP